VQSDTSSDSPARRGAEVRTFLFADVRGYTRYTREHGDEAASLLAARLAEVVREVVPRFHGDLFELRGDEAVSVFFSAREAIRAAVELQRRLREQRDGEWRFPLGVGMGIDSGEAVPTEGGFRGGALNLAARLCAIAKPGQILASDHAAHLAGRIDSVRLVDRRPVRLKGMERPVRLVEVVSEVALPPLPPSPARARRASRKLWVGAAAVLVVVVAAIVAGLAGSGTHPLTLKPDTIAELDTSSFHIGQQVASGGAPAAMAFGGGALWAAEPSTGQVERVDPSGGKPVPFPVGAAPSALVYAFHALWVANAADRTVTRISTTAGNAPEPAIRVGNDPEALVATRNGVWVASGLDDTVERIDPVGRVRQTIRLASAPTALTSFGSSVWVAEPGAGAVFRFDARSAQPTGSVPVPGGPVALAAGAGRVWIASADGTLSGVDPSGPVPKVAWTVGVGRSPSGLAVSGGSAWVGSSVRGDLTQVSPSGQVENTVRIGAPSGAIVASGKRGLWVATLPSPAAHRGGTLVGAVLTLEASTVDPVQIADAQGVAMIQMTNDGLVALRKVAGSGGYQLIPDLAAALPQPTPDGRTYTFQLRRGVHYSTGAVVKASDVLWTMERAFTSNPAAEGVLGGIVGANSCAPRGPQQHPPRHCDLRNGILVNNRSGTVTFHLTAPDPNLLAKLSIIDLAIVPAGTPRDPTSDARVPATGPYEIVRDHVNPNTGNGEIVLARNPHFHVWSAAAQPAGYPARIVFRADHGTTTGNQGDWSDVESGKADWTGDAIPTAQIPMLTSRYAAQLRLISSDETSYAVMDQTSAPFDDVRARQALNYAIDRQQILHDEGGKYAGIVTCQLLPPSFPGYQPYCPYTIGAAPGASWTGPDIAKAKGLVHESGTAGDRVVVGGFSDPVQAQLVKALHQIGYRVTTRTFPPTKSGGDDFDSWIGTPSRPPHVTNSLGWIADYPGAYDFLQLAKCKNRLNPTATFYCNPAFERRVDRALQVQQTNPAEANTLWAHADHYITDQAATVPLWNGVTTLLVSKRVGNVQYTPAGTGLPLIDQMWVR